jgi:hypothetical protein
MTPVICDAPSDILEIAVVTNEVFANWFELSPVAAVGVVGLPVKEGEAIVARNKISAVFAVILFVFEVTLVSKAFSAFVALVISAVILFVFEVTLVSKAFSAFVALVISAVMLFVFEVTLVSKAFSAFVALVISAVILFVFEVTLVSKAFSAFVALVISAVILFVFEAINVGSVPIVVELIPPTLLIVVVNVPVPLPLTSPVKVIN